MVEKGGSTRHSWLVFFYNFNTGDDQAIFDAPDRTKAERLNREIKRRTRVISVFPNETALLRHVAALLMETSEEWGTASKQYLDMEAD